MGQSQGVVSWWNVPWCIGGVLSVICFSSERKGATRITTGMWVFSTCFARFTLGEGWGAFTWSSNHDPPLMSRLDRFLVLSNWEMYFLNVSKKLLQQPISDPFPILLYCNCVNVGFGNIWLKSLCFVERVQNQCGSYNVKGHPIGYWPRNSNL